MNVFALKDYVESLGILWVPKIEQKETMFFLKDFFSERDMTKEEYEHVKNVLTGGEIYDADMKDFVSSLLCHLGIFDLTREQTQEYKKYYHNLDKE